MSFSPHSMLPSIPCYLPSTHVFLSTFHVTFLSISSINTCLSLHIPCYFPIYIFYQHMSFSPHSMLPSYLYLLSTHIFLSTFHVTFLSISSINTCLSLHIPCYLPIYIFYQCTSFSPHSMLPSYLYLLSTHVFLSTFHVTFYSMLFFPFLFYSMLPSINTRLSLHIPCYFLFHVILSIPILLYSMLPSINTRLSLHIPCYHPTYICYN